MQERRRPRGGDIRGAEHGDVTASGAFTDWDNPEDDEGAPEGYYEEADEDEDSYVPTPADPDYDLSEVAGYAGWEDRGRSKLLPGWLIVLASILLILALLTPLLIRIG